MSQDKVKTKHLYGKDAVEFRNNLLHPSKEYIANHSIQMEWDAEAGQNYGEFTSGDGTLNQIWMEDETSIGQKIDAMRASNIAGIAEWCLGMDSAEVWDVIAAYIGG